MLEERGEKLWRRSTAIDCSGTGYLYRGREDRLGLRVKGDRRRRLRIPSPSVMGRRARESRTGYRYWVKWNYEPAVPYRFSPPSVASSKKENSLLFIIQYIKLLPKNLEDTCKIEIMNIFLFINYNLAYMFMPNYSNKSYYQLK